MEHPFEPYRRAALLTVRDYVEVLSMKQGWAKARGRGIGRDWAKQSSQLAKHT